MDAAVCPWDAFDPATISFCEARLCSLVAEPANAFTSLSKTLVGLALIPACRRQNNKALWAIVVAALIQGPLGFSLHATGTFWGEALDVSGMFLISGMFVSFALARVAGLDTWKIVPLYAGLMVASVSMLLIVRPSGIYVFSIQIAIWVALEFKHARLSPALDRRALWVMVTMFVVGFGFWVLDKTGVACDPDNHFINGHAVWHVLTSLCLYAFFEHEVRTGPRFGPR